MRTVLAACVALSALGCAVAAPAQADIVVRTPGVVVDEGSYWRHHHPNSEWQARREFRDREYRREAWLRDHCVRDWTGHEYCRR